MDAFGPGALFVVIGVLAAVAVLCLTRLKTPTRRQATSASTWRNMTEGISFALKDRPIRNLLSLVALTEICGFAVISMLPVVAKEVLQADSRVLGSLMSLWGVGGMTASLTLSARGNFKEKGWVFAGAAFSMGLGLVLFSLSRELVLSLFLILLVGAAASTYDIMGNSLLQVLAPDALRGRITGVHSLLLSGSAAGSMGMGAIAETRGVALAIMLGGGVVMVNAVRILPRARTLGERPPEEKAAAAA
jgi:hypothetical protein